jgi:hypothetical protein
MGAYLRGAYFRGGLNNCKHVFLCFMEMTTILYNWLKTGKNGVE